MSVGKIGMVFKSPEGLTMHLISLLDEDGGLMGKVRLEYHDGEGWGLLHTRTVYGTYNHRWGGVPRTPTSGFEAFVASLDGDYLMEKLANDACRTQGDMKDREGYRQVVIPELQKYLRKEVLHERAG